MKNYTTQQALAVLAAAPDEVANNLGFWRDSAGKLGRAITREEARQGCSTVSRTQPRSCGTCG